MSAPRVTALRYLWTHHRWGMIGFGAALMLALLFAVRLTVFTIYWADPAHRNQPIAGWMTIGYVGRSWGVPPREIDRRAGLPPPDGGHPLTLEQIAEDQGMPLAVVIALVEVTVAELQAERDAHLAPRP